jgi:hypothetical protein
MIHVSVFPLMPSLCRHLFRRVDRLPVKVSTNRHEESSSSSTFLEVPSKKTLIVYLLREKLMLNIFFVFFWCVFFILSTPLSGMDSKAHLNLSLFSNSPRSIGRGMTWVGE